MYRDDWNAAVERVHALERELAEARASRGADARRIAALEGALAEARRYATLPGPLVRPSALPSQATTILVLGILSMVFCSVLGPIAWSQANAELDRVAAGLADPTRVGLVQAGKVLGIVATVLLALTLTLVFFVAISP